MYNVSFNDKLIFLMTFSSLNFCIIEKRDKILVLFFFF